MVERRVSTARAEARPAWDSSSTSERMASSQTRSRATPRALSASDGHTRSQPHATPPTMGSATSATSRSRGGGQQQRPSSRLGGGRCTRRAASMAPARGARATRARLGAPARATRRRRLVARGATLLSAHWQALHRRAKLRCPAPNHTTRHVALCKPAVGRGRPRDRRSRRPPAVLDRLELLVRACLCARLRTTLDLLVSPWEYERLRCHQHRHQRRGLWAAVGPTEPRHQPARAETGGARGRRALGALGRAPQARWLTAEPTGRAAADGCPGGQLARRHRGRPGQRRPRVRRRPRIELRVAPRVAAAMRTAERASPPTSVVRVEMRMGAWRSRRSARVVRVRHTRAGASPCRGGP